MAARKAPRVDVVRVTLPLAEAGGRLVVVADTHSAPHPASPKLVAREEPAAILHAGDIGDFEVLRTFEKIAPTFAVRGNIDGRAPGAPDVMRLDVTVGGSAVLRMLLLHIAVAGPRLRADALRLAKADDVGLVVCGHSHVPFAGRDRGVTVFNPGSIGPRRFTLPITFGVIDVKPTGITLRHMSCETGAEWSPPA